MNFVQNAKTNVNEAHAQSRRSFKRKLTLIVALPVPSIPAAIAEQSTSHEYENASAFLKYMSSFLISSM
jgi:hypothetical protein